MNVEPSEVGFTLAKPYNVFIAPNKLKELGDLQDGLVTLEFENKTVTSRAISFDDWRMYNEAHALFYLIASLLPKYDLPSNIKIELGRFFKENEILIDSFNELEDYLFSIQNLTNQMYNGKEILIGGGLLELLLKGKRDVDNLIETPIFELDLPTIEELFNNSFEKPKSIVPFRGRIIELDKVFFCTKQYLLPDKLLERIKDKIDEVRYFMLDGDYSFNVGFSAHGPIPNEKPLEGELYYVPKESAVFEPLLFGSIFGEKMPDFEDFFDIVKTLLGDYFDVKRESKNKVLVGADGSEIVFFYYPEEIYYQLNHFFWEELKESFNEFLNIIVSKIAEKMNTSTEFTEPEYFYGVNEAVVSEEWVFDTSAIYLQNYESILDFFMANEVMYQKTIVIPEIVLYEINLAKEHKKRLSDKGVHNLAILRKLEEYGFIYMEIRENEPLFTSTSLAKGDTSPRIDMDILRSVDKGSALVSRDIRLLELAYFKGRYIINPDEIIGSDNPFALERWREKILDFIEDKKPERDVISFLIRQITSFVADIGHTQRFNTKELNRRAKNIINRMKRSGEIYETRENRKKLLLKSKEVKIVLDKSILVERKFMVKKEGITEIDPNTLENIKKAAKLSDDVMPWCNVIVPKSLIRYSFEMEQELLEHLDRLTKIWNGRYTTHDGYFYQEYVDLNVIREDSLKICESEKAILITENKPYAKYAKLRGVTVAQR